MRRIIFTVTNDLSYDQRMHRIAGSLADAGYMVELVGRKLPGSLPLDQKKFQQTRLACFFHRGFLFYAAFNIRLFIFLLFRPAAILCAIDLDTILPVYFISILKRSKRVYDAHELFTEQKEIVLRPDIQKIWLRIEHFAVHRFQHGYTVNELIAAEFFQRYGVSYAVIRNLPVSYPLTISRSEEKWFLYQGAVNEGRCFETLIPAMALVDARLVICGEGNFFDAAKALISQHNLSSKIELKGNILPAELRKITPQAYAGITLFESTGLNQYYSLANRFFDHIMAGIPQVCVNYPAYAHINREKKVALLIDDTSVETIAAALNNLLANDVLHDELSANCREAKEKWNWDAEKNILLNFYKDL